MRQFPLVRMLVVLATVGLVLSACQKTPPPPSVLVQKPSAAERLEAGKKAFATGDYAGADKALAEAVRLGADGVEAHFYLGLCAATAQDFARAESELRLAAAAGATDPRPLEALGILQYERGDDRAEAAATLTAAVARGSKSPQVFYYQGNLAMFAGECPRALLEYRRAMQLDPAFAPAGVEYRKARVVCAKAETPPDVPASEPDPAGKPASKPKPVSHPKPKPEQKPSQPTVQASVPAPANP